MLSLIGLLCQDLQAQVEHGLGIAENITATCKKQVQVLVQLETTADIERDVGTSTRLLLGIAEQLQSEA